MSAGARCRSRKRPCRAMHTPHLQRREHVRNRAGCLTSHAHPSTAPPLHPRASRTHRSYSDLSELPEGFVSSVSAAAPNVTEIDLRSNALTELPDDFGDFKSLRVLRLNYNRLSAFPTVLVGLPRLASLELSGNQILRVDGAVAHAPALEYLDLSGNQLDSLPDGLCDVSTLVNVNLENNLLEELPADIGNLSRLQKLDLSTNRLTALPASVGKLRSLLTLDAASNQLQEVPASLGHVKTLREMDLRYNDLKEPLKSRLDEGLFNFLAFLREEEERLELEEIERLKPAAVEAAPWTEYRMKRPPAECPLMRAGHSICACGPATILFAGTHQHEGGARTSELWHIDTVRMEWKLLPTDGDSPGLRDGHCAAWDGGNRMYVFGGRNAERKRTSELYYLDLRPSDDGVYTWTRLAADGAVPAPREGACAVFHEGCLMVFGGKGSNARCNDLFFYDASTNMWSQPTATGSSPSPRCNAALAASEGMLFVHGGQANFLCQDLFALNLQEMLWREVPQAGAVPGPVHHHTAAVHAGSLYIQGGINELGGANYTMSRIALGEMSSAKSMVAEDAGESSTLARRMSIPAGTRKVWTAVNTALQHSDARLAVFSAEGAETARRLHVYQYGSAVLGFIPLNDAGTPGKFLDVFKEVPLDDLEDKDDSGAERRVNAKSQRINFTMRTKAGSLPPSYSATSDKEARMLEYVESFRLQFIELYPARRPLLLTPANESGTKKFVCTTLRPTMTAYSELYDADPCARFVADFLRYETLHEPANYPEHVPSPLSVLGYQAGDCFDFSFVLASLLLGVGYDAYVVVGYAPRAVTECDQSRLKCPLLDEEERVAKDKAKTEAEAAKAAAQKKPSKYSFSAPTSLESQFEKDMRIKEEETEAEEKGASVAFTHASAAGLKVPSAVDPDDALPAGCRVHCWVIVLAGKREVTESYFIEPSTGARFPLSGSPYQGIEVAFNQRNYWVNMQEDTINTGSVDGISWNLRDSSKWERVLEDSMYDGVPIVEGRSDGASVGGDVADGGLVSQSKHRRQGSTAGLTPVASDSARKRSSKVEGVGDDEHLIPDVPPSWVPPLHLARNQFDLRCPKGAKTTRYHRCHLDIFAKFGESARWDGMVQRLTLFSDDACSAIIECREYYERRKDRLRMRVLFPERDESIESFDRGAQFGLREIRATRKVGRVMTFYPDSRLDGLRERREEYGATMVETFEGRDDHMIRRSVAYDALPPVPEHGAEEQASAKALRERQNAADEQLLPLRKISEKFERDPQADAGTDIAKRVFYIGADQIKLQFHYKPGRITASSRVYTKDGTAHETQVDPFGAQPNESELLDEFRALIVAERECIASVRTVETEVKDISASRTKQEQGIALLVPFYDVIRVSANESDDDENEAENKAVHDYLSSFLLPVAAQRPLTHEECKEVRKACLRALKDRLIDRANIIQARHDEETAALAKRQANFQRDRDQMSRDEEEEYERSCEESMFRIHILEQRLKRHEEAALEKYYHLDAKLRADPRLRELAM